MLAHWTPVVLSLGPLGIRGVVRLIGWWQDEREGGWINPTYQVVFWEQQQFRGLKIGKDRRQNRVCALEPVINPLTVSISFQTLSSLSLFLPFISVSNQLTHKAGPGEHANKCSTVIHSVLHRNSEICDFFSNCYLWNAWGAAFPGTGAGIPTSCSWESCDQLNKLSLCCEFLFVSKAWASSPTERDKQVCDVSWTQLTSRDIFFWVTGKCTHSGSSSSVSRAYSDKSDATYQQSHEWDSPVCNWFGSHSAFSLRYLCKYMPCTFLLT